MTTPDAAAPNAAPPQPAAAAPKKPRRRWLKRLALALAAVFAIVLIGVLWLVNTQAGLDFALSFARPMVQADNARGTLASGFTADAVRVENDTLRLTLTAPKLDWRLSALLGARVAIHELSAERITLATAPSNEPPAPPRTTALELPEITLPVSLQIDRLHVGEFALQDWDTQADTPLVRDFAAALSSNGTTHHIQDLTVAIVPIQGRLTLDATAHTATLPYTAAAKLTLDGALPAAEDSKTHALNATVEADGKLDALPLRLHATVDQTAALQGDATLNALLPMPLLTAALKLDHLDPAHFAPAAPAADLAVTLNLQQPNPDPAQPWQLTGNLALTNATAGTLDQHALPLAGLDTALSLALDRAALSDLNLRLLGDGSIRGGLALTATPNAPAPAQLQAKLDIANIHPQALDPTLPETQPLQGTIEANATPAEQTALIQLAAGRAKLNADAHYAAAEARFAAKGELQAVNPADFIKTTPKADLNLNFDAQGTLQDTPALTAKFHFNPSTFEGRPLGGEGDVRLNGAHLARDSKVTLTLGSAKLNAHGGWGQPDDRLALTLDAPKLADLDLLKQGLAGSLKLAAELSGTAQAPAAKLDLDANKLRLPGGLALAALTTKGNVNWAPPGKPAPLALNLTLNGLTQPNEADPEKRTLLKTATLKLTGERRTHTLELTADQNGKDRARLQLTGGVADNNLTRWQGKLAALETQGRLPIRLQAPAPLLLSPDHTELGDTRLRLGTQGDIHLIRTALQQGKLHAQGNLSKLAIDLIALSDSKGNAKQPDPLILEGDWNLALADTLSGTATLRRTSGDLRIPGNHPAPLGLKQLQAKLNAKASRLQLGINIQGDTFGTLTANLATALTRTREGGWSLPPATKLDGKATLNIPDLSWTSRLVPDQILRAEGSIQGNVRIAGTLENPDITGTLTGEKLGVAMPEQGLDLGGGTLNASFNRDRLTLTRLAFVSPNKVRPNGKTVPVDPYTKTPGTLTASGSISLADGQGNFTFEADRLPVLQRPDRWLLLSGKGNAQQDAALTTLAANLKIDSGYIEMPEAPAPALGDDVITVQQQRAAAEAARRAAEEGKTRKPSGMKADIHIALGNNLHLSAMGLKTRLTGSLDIRQRDHQPLTAIGTVSTAGGTFRGYGQDLTIERGLINFQGPLDNPGLNMLALRKGLAVEAGVEVLGSARRPVIKLVSHPEVAELDKLAWIVLGRAPNGGPGDLAILATAAKAMFGTGGDDDGLTGGLQDALGLDIGLGAGEMGSAKRAKTSSVVADGSVVTDQGNSSMQSLTLGKRLSDRLTLSFEQSLTDAQTLAKLTYQLSRRLSLVIRGGTNNSADLYYTVSFR